MAVTQGRLIVRVRNREFASHPAGDALEELPMRDYRCNDCGAIPPNRSGICLEPHPPGGYARGIRNGSIELPEERDY